MTAKECSVMGKPDVNRAWHLHTYFQPLASALCILLEAPTSVLPL